MDQNFDGDRSDEVERAEYVKSGRGTESEDSLPFVKYDKSLGRKKRHKSLLIC